MLHHRSHSMQCSASTLKTLPPLIYYSNSCFQIYHISFPSWRRNKSSFVRWSVMERITTYSTTLSNLKRRIKFGRSCSASRLKVKNLLTYHPYELSGQMVRQPSVMSQLSVSETMLSSTHTHIYITTSTYKHICPSPENKRPNLMFNFRIQSKEMEWWDR